MFLGGTLLFRKPARTNELATAIEFAKTGDSTRMRQAMVSFRKYPDARAKWYPLVVPILSQADPVARDAAVTLLSDTHCIEALEAVLARLEPGTEPEANIREDLIRAVRNLGDPRAVPVLVAAAAKEEEPDLAVSMSVAAFELGGAGQDADLKKAADVLVTVLADDGAPHGARRDALEALRAHVALEATAVDEAAIAAWWQAHRDGLVWHAADHRLAPAS
jgi:HEAT repeat protein